MVLTDVLLLLGAGLATGFLASLVGIGGGVVFAPVLLFFFQGQGVAPEVLAPLTIGTSLLCTLVVSVVSAFLHDRRDAVDRVLALRVGVASAVAIFLMVRFVTTQPWFDARVFKLVFGVVLLVVVFRMIVGSRRRRAGRTREALPQTWPVVGGIGTLAGVVSSAAGVGGGVILVPVYSGALKLSMPRAVGTSSATIIFISLLGVLNYAAMGFGSAAPAHALGYVDVVHGLVLCVPSIVTARLGVGLAHRISRARLRLVFGLVAAYAAVRLILSALGMW